MLRAVLFTEAALDALGSLPMIHGESLIIHVGFLAGNCVHVVKAKVFRNVDVLRANLQAVVAAGALDGSGAAQDVGDLINKLILIL